MHVTRTGRFYTQLFTVVFFFTLLILVPLYGQSDTPEPNDPEKEYLPAQDTSLVPRLLVNQVGFHPLWKKTALLINGDKHPRRKVELVDAANNKAIVKVIPQAVQKDPVSGESVQLLDFGRFYREGRFFLRFGDTRSSVFAIRENVYDDALKKLLRSFYFQRCGVEVKDSVNNIHHPKCHYKDGIISRTDSVNFRGTQIVSAGGWHDAGDYGKYVSTATVTVGRILGIYEQYPGLFTDGQLSIPESGNNIPDLLDEMRFGIEWLFTMQRADGAVYRKLSGKEWPHQTPPHKDYQQRYLYGVTSAETGKYAATLGMAARLYKQVDETFSQRCLKSARRAWAYLLEQDEMVVDWFEGDDSGSGPYLYSETDNQKSLLTDADDRLWAAAELFVTTQNFEFQRFFRKNYLSMDFTLFEWKDPSAMGMISYWMQNRFDRENKTIKEIEKKILYRADKLLKKVADHPYRLANHEFIWGSNKMAAEEGITLFYAYLISDKESYFHAAADQLHYLLGRNAFDKSFVSGVGAKAVDAVCHLYAEVEKRTFPGLLVGGPNELAQAGIAEKNKQHLSYADHIRSYATNEYAIDYNASLIALLGMLIHESKNRMRISWN